MCNCRRCFCRVSLTKYINMFVPSLPLYEIKCSHCFVPGTDQKDLRNISAFLHCCFIFTSNIQRWICSWSSFVSIQLWNLAVHNATVDWYFIDSLSVCQLCGGFHVISNPYNFIFIFLLYLYCAFFFGYSFGVPLNDNSWLTLLVLNVLIFLVIRHYYIWGSWPF